MPGFLRHLRFMITRLGAVVVVVAAGLVGACGTDGGANALEPRRACDAMVQVMCERTLACLTADELARRNIPGTMSECIAAASAASACDSRTLANACPDGTEFQPDEAAACVDETSVLSCDAIRTGSGIDGSGVFGGVAPPEGACERTCLAAGADKLGEPCTMTDQGACGTGNKCAFVLDNETTGHGTLQCVPDGDRGEGASCRFDSSYGGYDDCRAGLACWDGACRSYCAGSADCDASEECIAERSDDPIAVCAERCDVVADNCPASEGCYAWTDQFAVCQTAGHGYTGAYCDQHLDCERGNLCVSGICERVCDVSQYPNTEAPTCDYGAICVGLTGDYPVFAGVGTCSY